MSPALAWLGAMAAAGMVAVVALVVRAEHRPSRPRPVVIRLAHGHRKAA
jgi:hypothetical protein